MTMESTGDAQRVFLVFLRFTRVAGIKKGAVHEYT